MREVVYTLPSKEDKVRLFLRGRTWFLIRRAEEGEYVVVGGREWGPYRDIYPPVASEDGRVWGMTVKKAEEYYVLLNGVLWGPYEDVPHFSPKISPDGSTVFIVGKEGGKYWVIRNGDRMGPFERVDPPHFARKIWGFSYTVGGKAYVRIGDEVWGPYGNVGYGSPFFSEDGERWAIIFNEGEGDHVVVDGETFGPYRSMWVVGFLEGGVWTAVGYEGGWFLVINGREFGPYEELRGPSPEGEFYAVEGKEVVVIRP